MREIIQARRYIPPWDLVYLNVNNNARQRPSAKTRNECGTELQGSRERHHRTKLQDSKQSDNLHTDNLGKAEKRGSAENDFNELNYVLMRENIEKMKRVKIFKQVKSIFNDMFSRVQDITDGLKVQLDDAMKEHRKANKMVNKLHNHIAGMQGTLDFQCENDTREIERNDMELAPVRGRVSRRLILPKIESANSSRTCSLPDVFKVDSSDQSPEGEELRVSRTRHIRKVAEKKSQEKSVMETSNTCRKKNVSEISREKRVTRVRKIPQTVSSANSRSSAESVLGQLDRRSKRMNSLYSLLLSGSGTSNNATQQIQVRDNSAAKSSTEAASNIPPLEKLQKEMSTTTVASTAHIKELNYNVPGKTSAKQRNEQTTASQKQTFTAFPYGAEAVNEKRQFHNPRKYTKSIPKLLPKVKKEQIVEKIKSIEECIIQPNRIRKESTKTFTDEEHVQKQGSKRELK